MIYLLQKHQKLYKLYHFQYIIILINYTLSNKNTIKIINNLYKKNTTYRKFPLKNKKKYISFFLKKIKIKKIFHLQYKIYKNGVGNFILIHSNSGAKCSSNQALSGRNYFKRSFKCIGSLNQYPGLEPRYY